MKTRTRQPAQRARRSGRLKLGDEPDLRSRARNSRPHRPWAEVGETARPSRAERIDPKDFFAAAEAREDRWQHLNGLAQGWREASQDNGTTHPVKERLLRDEAFALFKELQPLK